MIRGILSSKKMGSGFYIYGFHDELSTHTMWNVLLDSDFNIEEVSSCITFEDRNGRMVKVRNDKNLPRGTEDFIKKHKLRILYNRKVSERY